MFSYTTHIRVRYAETDQMQYVYHGNFATYFEVARTESLRTLGLSYKEFEQQGVFMPVLNLSINYKTPARYDDLLAVETIIHKLPGVRIHFAYRITNQLNQLICEAETTLVFLSAKTNKPVVCPDVLLDKLKGFFN